MIGDRMKGYEKNSHYSLTKKMPVFVRVDGRAFHTFTREFAKPFDSHLIETMVKAGEATAKGMSGFVLGYHQSDEFTFMLLDTATNETEAWFDNDLQKIVSITAATFTAHFNNLLRISSGGIVPVFDARAWSVPIDEATNVFIWRQRDWERNSLQMFSRFFFSQKQLHGKKRDEMHEMLHGIGQNWADLADNLKNGTFIHCSQGRINKKLDYGSIKDLITRVEIEIPESGIFKKIMNAITL